MAKFVIYTNTKDFEGNNVQNPYYVEGVEGAWNLYSYLADAFESVDLVDAETGEVIESTDESFWASKNGIEYEEAEDGYLLTVPANLSDEDFDKVIAMVLGK